MTFDRNAEVLLLCYTPTVTHFAIDAALFELFRRLQTYLDADRMRNQRDVFALALNLAFADRQDEICRQGFVRDRKLLTVDQLVFQEDHCNK